MNWSREQEALKGEVDRHTWLYSVDLGGGVTTRGQFGPPNPQIMAALATLDLRGKKVLDVGCFEGHWSFEAEKRGAAKVFATDWLVGDPRAVLTERGIKELPTFRLAHRILKSAVSYHPDISVYDVKRLGEHDFDVVLFCGVYYHLKHPLLAFSRLRQIIRDGGTLIVEGPVVEGPQEAFARFFYREVLSSDPSNWWVPTLPCLLQWVECSYFEILTVVPSPGAQRRDVTLFAPEPGVGSTIAASEAAWARPRTERIARYTLTARAERRKDFQYVLPDEELATFDLR